MRFVRCGLFLKQERRQAIERLRAIRVTVPIDYKFDCEEIQDRGHDSAAFHPQPGEGNKEKPVYNWSPKSYSERAYAPISSTLFLP